MRTLKDNNSLIKKWEYAGLLEYAQKPKMMAYCLEYSAKTLLDSGISENNGMIIPIIFRVINNIKPTFRHDSKIIIKDIMERFPSFMLDKRGVIDDLKFFTSMDWEAEMCQLFVEEYLKIYENNKSIR
jgi:anaerobic ribonucleoside-triphosphate reductase